MRIAVAELVQETGSFSPMKADLADFEAYGLHFGAEIYERAPDSGPLGGFREVAEERAPDATLIPLMRAWAGAGGVISAETFHDLRDRLTSLLRDALPVDAVFLSLHGAAASEVDDDVEGAILEAVRAIVGPQTPVVVALDHHANITSRMVKRGDALIGHETQPHDPKATGRKAAGVLFDWLQGRVRPTMAWRKIPMITPQDQFLTSQGPMQKWFDRARACERLPGVIDVSPYPMQPWLDVAEGGWAVVVHTNDDKPLAERLAREMAELAWSLREEFWRSERVAADEAARRADSAPAGLVLLSDTGDSVYGGAPGDSTEILSALLAARVSGPALVPLVDPPAVAAAIEAGVGHEITLKVGGRVAREFHSPISVTGRVAAVSLGLTIYLPERGVCDVGRCVLLRCGGVLLALLEERTFAINHPLLYQHLGVRIDQVKMVVLKTASNFQFFADWRRQLIRVDTAGPTQSNLSRFPWTRTPRPIFGLDQSFEWSPPAE